MDNLDKAISDVAGVELKPRCARKYFYKVYSYLLYQDTAALFETLDYRQSLGNEEKHHERYFVFRYMLRLIKEKHPLQFNAICPLTS